MLKKSRLRRRHRKLKQGVKVTGPTVMQAESMRGEAIYRLLNTVCLWGVEGERPQKARHFFVVSASARRFLMEAIFGCFNNVSSA